MAMKKERVETPLGKTSLEVLGNLICDLSDEWKGPKIPGLNAEYEGWTKKTEKYVSGLLDWPRAEKHVAALISLMRTTDLTHKAVSGQKEFVQQFLIWARSEVTADGTWPDEYDDDEEKEEVAEGESVASAVTEEK